MVDDEESMVRLITHNLQREGYETISAFEGKEAWDKIHLYFPDLIILDLMLPGMNGLELCQQLRQEKNHTPIIMLTARDEEIDRIIGLEIGADDYVTKPFSVRELLARVKAILRRRMQEPMDQTKDIEAGDLVLKPDNFEAYFKGEKLELTLREFELLELLVRNKGKVLKRDYLLQSLWGFSHANTRVLDVHISKLREKIESNPREPIFIKTVRGIGYKFEERHVDQNL